MPKDETSVMRGRWRSGAPLRTWLERGGYLLFEFVMLTPPLAIGGLGIVLVAGMPCMAPSLDGSDAVAQEAMFDPVAPFAVMLLVALAGVGTWGAYQGKPMVWKTQAVLALLVVIAALVLYDSHRMCTQ